MKHASILKKCLEDSCTSALDFVLSLLWVASKRGRTPSLPCYVSCARWIPRVDLWVHHLLTSCRSAWWVDTFSHFLPPAYVVCRKVIFSVMSAHSEGIGRMGPLPHGTVQTCSLGTSPYYIWPLPITWTCSHSVKPSSIKHVAHMSIGKQAVGVQLKGFLV